MKAPVVRLAVAALVCWLFGCGDRPTAVDPEVVATFSGGAVRAADVDREILALPLAQRRPADGDRVAWYGQIAREIALRELCLEAADHSGLANDPTLARRLDELRRTLTVDDYLERTLPDLPAIDDAEVARYFGEHGAELGSPARRLVSHIFRRRTAGEEAGPLVAELSRLRERALAGERFGALAAAHSDSETRHQDGALGWITRGSLSPELDRLVFSLEVGVPSPPITTASGVHLFLVEDELAEVSPSLDQARPLIRRLLEQERLEEAVSRLVGDSSPAGSWVATGDQLRALLAGGDPQAAVLRVGELEETVAGLGERMQAASRESGTSASPELAEQVLRTLYRREVLYQQALAAGLEGGGELERRRHAARRQVLADAFLQHRVESSLEDDEATLLAHYQAGRLRYSSPLRLRLELLRVPIGSRSNQHLALLEERRDRLDQGLTTLADLAAELGGEVEDTGWTTLAELSARAGRLPQLAPRLEPGRHTPPYRTQDHLETARLVGRQDPAPLPWAEVRDQVRDDYLAEHGAELRQAVAERLLAEAGFALVPERLEALSVAAAQAPEPGP